MVYGAKGHIRVPIWTEKVLLPRMRTTLRRLYVEFFQSWRFSLVIREILFLLSEQGCEVISKASKEKTLYNELCSC